MSFGDPTLKMNSIEFQMQGELPYKVDRGAGRTMWGLTPLSVLSL